MSMQRGYSFKYCGLIILEQPYPRIDIPMIWIKMKFVMNQSNYTQICMCPH